MERLLQYENWDEKKLVEELVTRRLNRQGIKLDLVARLYYSDSFGFGEKLDTKIVAFDNRGIDPRELIGHRILKYEFGPEQWEGLPSLQLLCNQKNFQILYAGPSKIWPDPFIRVKVDLELLDFLKTLDHPGPGYLTIRGAATGVRRTGMDLHRVIGIHLEGMGGYGFVYCEDMVPGNLDEVVADIVLERNYTDVEIE